MSDKDKFDTPAAMAEFAIWKEQAVKYLHGLAAQNPEALAHGCEMWDWILGNDEDMRVEGYEEGMTPEEYVDYQFECAQ